MKMFKTTTLLVAAVIFAASSAQANIVFTLSQAADGGVELSASGLGGSASPYDNSVAFSFDVANMFGSVSQATYDTSGSLTVGADTLDVDLVTLRNDTIKLISNVGDEWVNGDVTANNITAIWAVDQIAFNTLTPGTYAGTGYITGTELVVVPEPATMSLLAIGGLALIRRKRNK